MSERTPNEVRALREAFVAGAEWQNERVYGRNAMSTSATAAARIYPMPTVTVPRVVGDDTCVEWSVIDGTICWRCKGAGRFERISDAPGDRMYLTEHRARIIADLLANPTETREAE